MRKHKTPRLALIAAVAVAVSGAAHAVELRVDATPSTFADAFRALADQFQKENPDVTIRLDVSQRDQNDLVQRTLRQAIVDDLPDVSFQGYNYLRTLVDRDLLVPLDPFIESDTNWSEETYSHSVTNTGTVRGEIYGLGVGLSVPVIFYNKNLVSEANGGDGSPGSDWEDIFSVAAKIQEKHQEILGVYARYNDFLFQGFLGSFGGSMMNADETEITFDDPAGRNAFDLLKRFGEAGQAKVDMTRSQAREAFIGGTVAMIADSSSTLESYERQTEGRFEVGVAPLPLSAENAKLPAAGVAVVMMAKDEERQKAAWRFMAYVAGPAGQAVIGRMTGYIPVNQVAIKREDVLGAYYAERPNYEAALNSLPIAQGWYAFPGENAARINTTIEDRLGEVVTLRVSPEDAVAELAEEVSSLIGN